VKIAYDPAKNARNIAVRGLSFDDVPLLDWTNVILRPDTRHDYGEDRTRAWLIGPDYKPYSVVFRRAHEKEFATLCEGSLTRF
jgi:hypothetical protein